MTYAYYYLGTIDYRQTPPRRTFATRHTFEEYQRAPYKERYMLSDFCLDDLETDPLREFSTTGKLSSQMFNRLLTVRSTWCKK